ncbi:MAG TPA: hypothetical protein VID26_11355 [Candidatus Limnocylindrales bacterium]
MRSKHRYAAILSLTVLFAACTTGGASGTVPPSVPLAVVPPPSSAIVPPSSASTAPSSAPSSGPAASGAQPTPGSIDPCSLLTSEEASTLMGKKLGAGVSATLDPDRVCTFKSGLTEVKLILAPPAPDAATAQAYWDQERSQVPAELPVADLNNVFDRAAFGSGSAGGLSISALFVIQGTTFFDLFCAMPGCTVGASVTAAQLIVGRLP